MLLLVLSTLCVSESLVLVLVLSLVSLSVSVSVSSSRVFNGKLEDAQVLLLGFRLSASIRAETAFAMTSRRPAITNACTLQVKGVRVRVS